MALAAFPIATLLAPNPTRFHWSLRHGSEPMPPEVSDRAESADRSWYFFVDAIIVVFVASLMLWEHVSGSQVGLRLTNPTKNTAIGAAAGAARVFLLNLLTKVFPPRTADRVTDRFRRGPAQLWVIIFFAGAFSEELWIALCLVVLQMNHHSSIASAALTAAVFGAVHFEYRLGTIVTAMYCVFSAVLFLWLGSLIPMFLFHFIGNLGSLYWARRSRVA